VQCIILICNNGESTHTYPLMTPESTRTQPEVHMDFPMKPLVEIDGCVVNVFDLEVIVE